MAPEVHTEQASPRRLAAIRATTTRQRLGADIVRLSRQMIGYWGAFARAGAPEVPGQPAWPQDRGGPLMSLRPGGHSQVTGGAVFAAEHHCGFWDGAGQAAQAAARAGAAPRAVTWVPGRPSWLTLNPAG